MKRILVAIALLATLAVAVAQDATLDMSDQTIGEILDTTDQVSILNHMVEIAGLEETLSSGGPFTVFAPVDTAWVAIDTATINELMRNPESLQNVLLYHVVSGEVDSARLFDLLISDARERIGDENTAGMEVEDPADALEETGEDGAASGDAPLDQQQIGDDATANVDIEDPVEALLATGVTSAVTFETVQGAMLEASAGRTADTQLDGGQRIGEGDRLLGISEPVAALRAEGVDLMVGGANVVSVDIVASNGVIHLIDAVLVPEGFQMPK